MAKALSEIKHVCIVGAGSIGSLYAGHLGSIVDVSVLTRRSGHAEQLNQNGLHVSGKTQGHVQVKASTDPRDLGEPDLVIIATKTIDVESSIRKLKGHFPNAFIMLAQNGLGCESLVQKYGAWPIFSAVTFMAGTRHSDTHVEYELDTATWLGPWDESNATEQDACVVADLLNASGLIAEAYSDLRPMQWSKLIFNATVNSVSAVTNVPFDRCYVDRSEITSLGHLVYEMMEEGKSVAAAYGVVLNKDPWEMAVQAASQYQKTAGDGRVPSMLADVRAQQKTEVDWITGAIVRAGHEVGVQVPCNASMYRLVKALERSWKNKKD